jgi:DnaK suppressor protein
MNVQHFNDRLLDLKNTLTAQTARAVADGRQQFTDSARDAGEASVADAAASEAFTAAEQDSTILAQVIDALKRVDDGTFGRCVVDGEPIDEKRLEALPWTPYCLKHEALREASSGSKMPTL